MASHKQGPGAMPRAKAQAGQPAKEEGHSRSYHRVSVFCSTILVAGRPLVPSQPSPD